MSLKSIFQNRLLEMGYAPKKSLGQNFLINERAIEKIVLKAADLKPSSLIEIGPGLGALTDSLKIIVKDFTLIELDRGFAQYWRHQNLLVIEADALQLNWQEQFQDRPRPTGLVSNLPYQISARLVIELSLNPGIPDFMVLMFQKEVAVKIKAPPRAEDYGLLTVIAQTFWSIEMVLELSSGDFFPPPQVASRVLSFQRKETDVVERSSFLGFVKACFHQRRKLLRNNLNGWLKTRNQSVEVLDETLIRLGYSPKARAEEIEVPHFKEIFFALVGGTCT